MSSFRRKLDRRPLPEILAEHRRKRGGAPRKAPEKPTLSVRRSACGPGGAMREHPNIDGIQWLRFFGEALVMHGVAAACRVSVDRWEQDECLSLHLQRVVQSEASDRLILSHRQPKQGGMWEHWRIPIGACNGHDTRWVLKTVLTPKEADLVFASNAPIRAMHSL